VFDLLSKAWSLIKIIELVCRLGNPDIRGRWIGTGSNSNSNRNAGWFGLKGSPTSYCEKFDFKYQIFSWCLGEFIWSNPENEQEEVTYKFLAKFISKDTITADFKSDGRKNIDRGAFMIKLDADMKKGQGAAFSIDFKTNLPSPTSYKIERILQ
jgi:hypothetical protein